MMLFILVLLFSQQAFSEINWSWELENKRIESSVNISQPEIQEIFIQGKLSWQKGHNIIPTLQPNDIVTLIGRGFGAGPNIDFSKIMLGKIRALERDLPVFQGEIDIVNQLFYESDNLIDRWKSDIISWNDTKIVFTVPEMANEGPLVISIAKRTGFLPSLEDLKFPFLLKDPITERIKNSYSHLYDSTSILTDPISSNAIAIKINNPKFSEMVKYGEKIFWTYDFNMGLAHSVKKMDWEKVMKGKAIDLITHKKISPEEAFAAIPLIEGEVPAIALKKTYYEKYPSQNPIKSPFADAEHSGYSKPTGYAGYVSVEGRHPITMNKGSWIGFNCASCHTRRISFESEPGVKIAKVFAGLPNPKWTMKWAALGGMHGIKETTTDRSLILYSTPSGTGEHTLVRKTNDGSEFANDDFFSPIAIPIITRHTPIRRALSNSDLVAGFEGSYLHPQEADGGTAAMHVNALKAFTSYMSTLDQDHITLQRLAIYRTLKEKDFLNLINNVSEGELVKNGYENYAALTEKLQSGEKTFNESCLKCHQSNFGMNTDERMFSFSDAGTYFGLPLFSKKNQAFRTAFIRDLYWVKDRGLLHDGHVKSIEDLISPERCQEGSTLYNQYYTLHTDTFKIPKGNAAQERALRRHANFVDVSWDSKHLYYDYQTMRKQFGPRELNTTNVIPLPATPHPWCLTDKAKIDDLTIYLITL